MHFKVDSSTLWDVLGRALGVQHPRTVVYQTVVRATVRAMNSSHRDLAKWAAERWFQSGELSTEARRSVAQTV